MQKNFGQQGHYNKGIIGIGLVQALQGNQTQNRIGSNQAFNQNMESSSQYRDEMHNRIETLQQIDDNISNGQVRMDTSQSALNQNAVNNRTQQTQQNSSKGNLNSQSNFPYDLGSEQIRNREYSNSKRVMTASQRRVSSNQNQNKNNIYNNKTEYRIKNVNQIKHNGSFYSQQSDNLKGQDKFGFIKADTLYGTGKNDGLFNSDIYINSLQEYLKERNENKRSSSQSNNQINNYSVMDKMQEHIEYTNQLQKKFIEQSMNSIDAAAHERFLKYENNEQSILNKLNKHILFSKERDHIHQLTKAEFMKNSFIPCKQEEDNEIVTQPQTKQQKSSSKQNESPSNKPKQMEVNTSRNHNEDYDIKINESPKLIHVHKDSENNIINRLIIEKPVIQIKNSNVSSFRNSPQSSPRQPSSKLQNQQKSANSQKEQLSPTKRGQQKVENDDNDNLDKLISNRSSAAHEEKKQIPFLKQQTMKDTQQQEQINEKQMLQKNRKALKNKIEQIILKHQKVNKDIDYAYQEVNEQIKKKEILRRMRSISDSQTPFNFGSNTPAQHPQIFSGSTKNNLQRLGKLVMGKNSTGFSQVMQAQNQQGLAQKRNSVLNNNNNLNNQLQTPMSNSGQPSGLQQLELQKRAFLEGIQNAQNENKIYFQAQYKLREKGLMFDLSNSNNKEQVLDRVLMNYFHQQDLLNEQENILKKANRNSISGRSASRGKSYKTKELGSLLSKFQPQHIRLHLKDLQKGVSGGGGLNSSAAGMSTSQQNQSSRHHRSMTAASGIKRNSLIQKDREDYYQGDQQDEDNVDVNIFQEKYEWKKKQNKIINFSKVCSPAEMVLQFMKQDPRYKKQQNIEAIDFLVQFDPKKAKEEGEMEGKEEDSSELQEKLRKRYDDSIMRRCFFFHSNKNDSNTSDRFQEVTLKQFLKFFFTLAGQEFDETLEIEAPTPFSKKNNTFQQQESNEISFFGHLVNKNKLGQLEIPQRGEGTSKNQKEQTTSMHQILILGDNHIEVSTLKTIFDRITSKKEKHVLNYYEFLEAIRKTSVQYYLQKISQDNIPQPQELFEKFFIEYIRPMHMSFLDPEEQELVNMRQHKQIDSLLKLFEDNLKDLFVFAGSMRSQTTLDFSQIYLGFQETYEILQKLDFFPNKISKTTIRYIYYYTLSLDQGLDFHDFCQCLHLIGLRIIRYPLKNTPITQTPQEIYNLQRKCREIQYTIFKLKQEALFNQNMQKFIQDISLFYVHKDYIEYQRIQQKIIDIKESNQKQLQMM